MEQLLLRERINMDSSTIEKYILNKKVLITGAAGSIGSELCKQIMAHNPAHLFAIDHNESGIHNLQAQFGNSSNLSCRIANITHEGEMQLIFNSFRPDIVFHVAAYKHVCILEVQPDKAISNNILGTKIVADLAAASDVEKFIFISTDKAVNPVSMMGISKRVSELYLLSLNEKTTATQFIITRFGNVLGSSGSVFPIFLGHIQREEPISITHPQATRYFMTIPEAAHLVLESAAVGNGGEIMIFDMGEPMLILDLASRMIKKYHNSTTGKTIEIRYIGLRPGEKMHEELYHSYERKVRNHKSKIKVLKTDNRQAPDIYGEIDSFHETLLTTTPPDHHYDLLRGIFTKHNVQTGSNTKQSQG
jgi:FlaA1/EpsC-like NDP-sugar epimerase